jgi:hypothetical protein
MLHHRKQHGGHAPPKKQTVVVPHAKPKEKHHNEERDPAIYLGSGDIKQHTYSLSDNLTKYVHCVMFHWYIKSQTHLLIRASIEKTATWWKNWKPKWNMPKLMTIWTKRAS